MAFKYRMFNAPSARTIDQAARLGCNWAIVHSHGIESPVIDPQTGRERDMLPIYFQAYPKVAEARRRHDGEWIDSLRRQVLDLCDRAAGAGLNPAMHLYEPVLPWEFERKYPQLVGTWSRPTQSGTVCVHTCLDPDRDSTWELLAHKYAELAAALPAVKMFILSTWDHQGTYWCIPKAKMPIARRIVRMIQAAREGVAGVRGDCAVCLRLWGRNWPRGMYLDSHRLIAEITGVHNASQLMEQMPRPHNDPEIILPAVFAELPADVPIMYKSTNIDIADAQPITLAAGNYPPDREQIIEVSYENYHRKPWPWCKLRHIRKGLAAATEHDLAGFLALPVNMGNNDRKCDPEAGNLGRMNTWLLEKLLAGDTRDDGELVSAWLAEKFGSPQPRAAAEVLLEAEDIVDMGIQWDAGVPNPTPFASLHTTKLYWMFYGFADPAFPYRMANPDRPMLERLMQARRDASERAAGAIQKVRAAAAAMAPKLFEELMAGLTMLDGAVGLCRDWHCHLLMQYGIERGLYPADRVSLGRMSRHAEAFIRGLMELRDTPAGKWAASRLRFPDQFALT